MRCTSTNKLVQKSAAEFPDRLRAIHGGKIVVVGNPVFKGVMHPIKVKCNPCTHTWISVPNRLVNQGKGCPNCANQANSDSAGKRRCPRATQAEQNKALELRAQGLKNQQIVAALKEIFGTDRSESTLCRWADPTQQEKARQYANQWYSENRERQIANCKQWRQTPHGKAKHSARNAQQRVRWWERLEDGTIVYCEDPPLVGKELELAEAFYLERDRLIAETGIEHHVDHIRPIAIGGTHHDFNLQVLPGADNRAKRSKFSQDDLTLYAERLKPLFANPTHN